MTDEEKKAIETIEELLRSDEPICEYMLKHQEIDAMRSLLHLIEKQSKEIEELNKSDASKEQSSMKYYNLYKELVDKIKAKIEEVKDGTYDAKIVLQSLLEKE